MGFVKDLETISGFNKMNPKFYDAECLTVYFETKTEIVSRLLPPPLKPADFPIGAVFLANYPKTNFGVSYLESALFLLAQHDGDDGVYCLSMPVTNDIALILGRELFGYPKKMAKISFEREGKNITGWTERKGTRFMEIRATFNGNFNDVGFQQMFETENESNPNTTVYNFKYFHAPDRNGFDYNPRLMKEEIESNHKSKEMGEAEIIIKPSEHDPWMDVEIVKVYGATYTVGDNTMLPGSVVAETEQAEFAPFSLMKLDSI